MSYEKSQGRIEESSTVSRKSSARISTLKKQNEEDEVLRIKRLEMEALQKAEMESTKATEVEKKLAAKKVKEELVNYKKRKSAGIAFSSDGQIFSPMKKMPLPPTHSSKTTKQRQFDNDGDGNEYAINDDSYNFAESTDKINYSSENNLQPSIVNNRHRQPTTAVTLSGNQIYL